jgi:hypothetical protein
MKIAVAAIVLLLICLYGSISDARKCEAKGGTFVYYGHHAYCLSKDKPMPW